MGRTKPKDKRLLVACEMPPLQRTPSGGSYQYKTDEVLNWISKRPGLLMYVFDKLTQGGYIKYNPDTQTWQGVDYDGE